MSSVAVAGAGVMGAGLARSLAAKGHEVTVYEPEAPGHPASTSGDHTRVFRCAHGADRFHAALARQARAGWRALEAEAGRRLYEECGVVWIGRRGDGWEGASERTLRALGIPCRRAAVREALPGAVAGEGEWALVEPEAGLLRAGEATRALMESAQARGARLVPERADPADPPAADLVVWACGPWLATLFPGLVPLRVTRQQVAYLDAPSPGPVWLDYDRSMYGHGDLGHGVKVASDREGPDADPRAAWEAGPVPGELRAAVAERFPALAAAEVREVRPCRYELTPDARFLLAPLPGRPGEWVLGGGSGHAFKHGPAWGDLAAEVITGERPGEPRFGLRRAPSDRRLRTAGATPRATPA